MHSLVAESGAEPGAFEAPIGGRKAIPPVPPGQSPRLAEGLAMTDRNSEEPRQPVSPTRMVRMGLLFYAVVMAAALVWRVGFDSESILFASALDEARGVHWLADIVWGFAAGGGLVVVSFLAVDGTRWGREMAEELASALGPIGLPNAMLLAFASGLAEEMFFRGALQPRVGLVAASFLFAVLHFLPRRSLLPWTAFALVAGLLFGVLFQWTGNLIAPVIAHVVVNAVNLPFLERRFGQAAGES